MSTSLINVIDVGAKFGLHPSFAAIQEESAFVLIDADLEECRRLSEKYRDNLNIKIENYFVSDSTDETTISLNLYKHPGGHSAFFPQTGNFYWDVLRPSSGLIVGTSQVAVSTLDEIVSKHFPILGRTGDFLKIDVEGAEIEVLKSASYLLSKVVGIRIEVLFNSLYENMEPTFGAVDVLLRRQGFTLLRYEFPTTAYAPFSNFRGQNSYGAIIGADGIYIRNISSILSDDTITVLKTAIFSSINGSVDLALYLLEKICSRKDYFSNQNLKYLKILERLIAKSIFENQDLPGQSLIEVAPLWEKIFQSEPLTYGSYFIRFG